MPDIEALLSEVEKIDQETKKAIAYRDAAVRLCLATGATYEQVGAAINLTKGACWQKYGPKGARGGARYAADSAAPVE
jgi:hypothetical protein